MIITPTNSFLLLGFLHLCNFGENPSRNASVRVHANGHTNIWTLEQRQTGFTCPILYAISYGTNKINNNIKSTQKN